MNQKNTNKPLEQMIVDEFIEEKKIVAYEKTDSFERKVKLAIQFLDETIVGTNIDYNVDLEARNLIKEYVFYDFYNMLPEFKERYANELTKLQFKYNSSII